MNKIYLNVKTLIDEIRGAKLSMTIKTPFVNFYFALTYIKSI